MSKEGKFLINHKTRLRSRYFNNNFHCVDYMTHLKYMHHKKSFWNYFTTLLGEDAPKQEIELATTFSTQILYLNYIMKK